MQLLALPPGQQGLDHLKAHVAQTLAVAKPRFWPPRKQSFTLGDASKALVLTQLVLDDGVVG